MYKSELKYHLVFCTKYKRKILYDDLKSFLETQISNICSKYNYIVLTFDVNPEHIHLCLELKPSYSISSVVRNLKVISSYNIFKTFPKLRRKYYLNSGFWSLGYYVSSIGNVSKDKILEYIKNQEDK
jgi:putative transposase